MENEQIAETWLISNRVGLYLLDSIPEEHLADTLVSKGRSVAEQFAHIHNVRLMWLKAAMPEGLEGLTKLEKGATLDKPVLARSLEQSAEAIANLMRVSAANGGKVKGFKPHVIAFLGYFCSHEAHHRSQIILALKQSGHPVDKKVSFGIWEWGTR